MSVLVRGEDEALRCMSSSTMLFVRTIVSGWCPFSNNAYFMAWARLTNSPPKSPFCSWATQLPLLFRPMMTRLAPHVGGSSVVFTIRSWLPAAMPSKQSRCSFCDDRDIEEIAYEFESG